MGAGQFFRIYHPNLFKYRPAFPRSHSPLFALPGDTLDYLPYLEVPVDACQHREGVCQRDKLAVAGEFHAAVNVLQGRE